MTKPQKDERGQIQRSNGNGPDQSMAAFLARDLAPQIKLALPKHLDGDRMARVALTALRANRDLAECDKYSFAGAIIQAAQLGLEVNTPLGHAYLIPRKGVCTLQLGYQGMIELARRSGQVSSIFAFTVHAGDTFSYELGLDPKLRHVPAIDAPQTESTMTFVYAVARLKGEDHDRQFVVLSKAQVEARKNRGHGGPAWRSDYLAMARKTAVRALFTWLPKSPEMARAVVVDDADVTDAKPADVLDAQVVEQLSAMALAPTVTTPGDPSPAEQEQIAREPAEENERARGAG